MKKMLPILLLLFVAAILFSACNSKPSADDARKVLTYTDTVGLADFQKWKVQNELKDPAVYYSQGKEVATTQPRYASARKRTTARSTTSKSGSMNSVSQYPAKTTTKKGWSRRAKGAAIGGGGGAILGA